MHNRLLNSHHLNHFINQIYRASYNPSAITDVIKNLKDFIDAPYAAFQVQNQHTHDLQDSILMGYDDHAIQSYSDYFVTRDPWTIEGFKQGTLNKGFISGQNIVPDKSYCNSEFYQDWGQSNGVRHAIGSGFEVENGYVVKISFQRHQDHFEFNKDVEQFLNFLRPHIQNYVQLSPIFKQQAFIESQWQKSLDYINRPVWIVDKLGRLRFSNKKGNSWLEDESLLMIKSGKLTTRNNKYKNIFSEEIYRTSQLNQISSITKKITNFTINNQNEIENLWLTPLPLQEINQSTLIMIVGRELLPNEKSIELLFSLSPRQSQVCSLLAQGLNLPDIAAQLNISINTVKNTMYLCFKKIGVKNQSELIIKLLSGLDV